MNAFLWIGWLWLVALILHHGWQINISCLSPGWLGQVPVEVQEPAENKALTPTKVSRAASSKSLRGLQLTSKMHSLELLELQSNNISACTIIYRQLQTWSRFLTFCDLFRTFLWMGLPIFGKPSRKEGLKVSNWLTVKQIWSRSETRRSVSVSWMCHPTNFGQDTCRRRIEVEAQSCCACCRACWLLVTLVVLSHVMYYNVLPVLTSRSCRSQERGAIRWLWQVCVAIDGMHRIA